MTANSQPLNVLHLNASSRYDGSITRALSSSFVDSLSAGAERVQVQCRDIATGLPFIDADWIAANYTPAEQRSEAQLKTLAQSDALVHELQAADIIVIGSPVYNFSIPVSLKAWIDLVARAGLTFRYTENGPVGLLQDKKAYVFVASGGMPVGSEADFASRYLQHVLGFIGIDDVSVIAADRVNQHSDAALASAEQQLLDALAALREAA